MVTSNKMALYSKKQSSKSPIAENTVWQSSLKTDTGPSESRSGSMAEFTTQ